MSHPFGHFSTVTHHRHLVLVHCIKAGIPLQGLLHDLSKFTPAEFVPGAKYWEGTRSPTVRERLECGSSAAWMHHKGRNKHHFEYWTDYLPGSHGLVAVPMPRKYLVEMFCDRVAASKTYLGGDYTDSEPLEYFLRGHASYLMHPDTSAQLEQLLRMLAKRGEDETFSYIKKHFFQKRRNPV